MPKVALALGGVLIAVALGVGIPALMAHASERAAWAAERAKQGTESYDARASDRHYRASRDAWQRSAPAGHLLGAGLLLFTLSAVWRPTTGDETARRPSAPGATPEKDSERRAPVPWSDDRPPTTDSDRTRAPATGPVEPRRLRVAAASTLDALLGGALLALHWLDAGESASIRALTAAAPWLAALPFAPLVAGSTLGMRLAGLRADGGARALIALALWPLASLSPLGLLARPLAALHLRVAGLEVHERQQSRFAES